MLKFIKIAILMSVFICAAVLMSTGEADAAGYDVTWSGLVVYLSKAEALKMAENLEVNANWGAALGAVGIWLPDSIYKKVAATIAAYSNIKYRADAAKLRNCSARGATVTFPWIGLGAMMNFEVKSR